MTTEFQDKVRELIDDVGISMLTTMTADGKHVSRPMAVQQTDEEADLWFFAYNDSNKTRQIASNPHVNVSFSNGKRGTWISVAGRAEVMADRALIEKLWSPSLNAWFPDGKETPGITLIKVEAESAEYWDTTHSKVATAFSLAKAAVTNKTASGEIGSNESGTM